ncbi:MAG: hypothetical protein ACJ73J_00425 [Actinomycetes bacterium]
MTKAREPRWPTVVLTGALAMGAIANLVTLAQHGAGYPHIVDSWFQASIAAVVYGVVGWFIARRVPGHRLGTVMLVLSCAVATQFALGATAIMSVQEAWPDLVQTWLGGLYNSFNIVVTSLLLLVVLIAPTGQPLNRFYANVCRVVILAATVSWLSSLLIGTDETSLPGGPTDHSPVPDEWASLAFWIGLWALFIVVGASLLAIVGLVLRYRRTSGEARRQVTWVVGGGLAGITVVWVQGVLTPWLPDWPWLETAAWAIGPSLLPLGIAVAVLRHGLYELDSVVSRTVSYAVVTGAVVAVYAIVVATVSQLAPGSDSVAVAAATLTAAAIARPLLRRVRDRVDSRFNRARFDHEQAVASYSAQLRSTVDPDVVRSQLLDILQRTLEPRSVVVWVRTEA